MGNGELLNNHFNSGNIEEGTGGNGFKYTDDQRSLVAEYPAKANSNWIHEGLKEDHVAGTGLINLGICEGNSQSESFSPFVAKHSQCDTNTAGN